jgi:DNA-binding Lrp family transcriptional regulator
LSGQDLQVERAVHEALMKMRSQDRLDVARFMIDPVVLYILAATSRRCLTVSEMSPIVNMPPATCYKMIYQMERLGLVAYCGPGRNGGRGKASTYTSVLREMRLDVRGNTIHLTVAWKNGTCDEFHREMMNVETEADGAVGTEDVHVTVARDGAASSD